MSMSLLALNCHKICLFVTIGQHLAIGILFVKTDNGLLMFV